MGGYIGATAVGLTTTAADVQGDITSTDTTPELILKNTSEEDTEGGREGKITFKGEQSGGEETTLAQIESAHDGTSDDEKGDLIFKTNDGNDGASPTERLRLDSAGDMLLSSPDPSLTITNTTHEDTDGGRESTIVFKGEQSGGELSTLAEIEASHDGTSDDEKGDLIFRTNDGSDGASPTEAMRIDSDGNVGIGIAPTNASDHHSLALSGNANNGAGFIEFNDTSGNADAAIFADNGTLTLHADYDNATASSKIVFRVDGSTERVTIDTNSLNVDPNSVGNHYGIFNTSSSGDGHILLQRSAANKYQVGSDTSNNFFIYNYTASGYALKIDTQSNLIAPRVYNNTSSGTANVGVGASGEFYRSTSSLRYKNTVNDATHGLTELLTLRPVTFKGNNDGDTIFGGLIAEEVHDAGLTEFVEYDDQNRPDALAYGNMVSLCIKAIQEQQSTITAQATKIETLETQNTTQATQIADLITRVEALEGA